MTDKLTAAQIEAIANPVDRLRVIMKRLLDPEGCPWDQEQTHLTLCKYLIEESHEVVEAIESGDDAEFCEELGDLALQVVFHAELAERRGAFRLEDAYDAICNKLIHRHPHVFGELNLADSDAVLKNWEVIKKEEKRRKAAAKGEAGNGDAPGAEADSNRVSALSGVPRGLPGLHRAARIQDKAARVGFDWERAADVAKKVREEVEEFLVEAARVETDKSPEAAARAASRMEEEFGDLLFSLVNLSRFMGFHAEEAMRRANDKFTRRFMAVEALAEAEGRALNQMTLAEMDALWDRVKTGEKAR